MRKTSKLLVLLVASAASVFGAEISPEAARTAVTAWLSRERPLKGVPAGVRTLVDPRTDASVHVVDLRGGGYVVTAADDLRGPVLAFSEKGTFRDDPRNPLWLLTLGGARVDGTERESVAAQGVRTKAQKLWDELLGRNQPEHRLLAALPLPAGGFVGRRPFVKTSWGQTSHNEETVSAGGLPCFDYYVPPYDEKTGDRGPCGCVATAGAQVMRHYRYPEKAVVKDVRIREYGRSVLRSTSGETYRWNDMPEDVRTECSLAARMAIGRLTRDIGIACESEYDKDATSASAYDLTACLKNVFGYRNAQWFAYGSAANFRRDLIPNLDAGCPVVLSIFGYEGIYSVGHAVVVDGYAWNDSRTEFYISVNMGWQDYGSGWYAPPEFDYDPQYLPYEMIEGFVGNIFPDRQGQIVSGSVLGADGRPVVGASVTLRSRSGFEATTTTDTRGIYWFAAATGSYTLAASVGVVASAPTTVVLSSAHNEMKDLKLALSATAETPTVTVGAMRVSLACTTPDATIRYTLDGTEPDGESTVYEGPFSVYESTSVKARAFKVGLQTSATASAPVVVAQPDDFSEAWPVTAESGAITVDNVGATTEMDEPEHSIRYVGGASVWLDFTPPSTGLYVLRASCENSVWTVPVWLSAYTGDSVDALTRVATSNSNGMPAQVILSASAGETYRVALDTYRGGSGAEYCGGIVFEWRKGDVITSAETELIIPGSVLSGNVTIDSSVDWQVTDASDWITVETATGASGSDLTFVCSANGTGSVRKGVILVKAGFSGLEGITVWQFPFSGYVIRFISDGDTGAMADQYCLPRRVYNLDPCSFRAPFGKTFAGWVCKDTNKFYDDGVLIFDLASPGETVTLTANWK